MTVFRVRFISFEPLVGLTENFVQMSAMLRQCAVPMFDQVGSRSRSELKIKHCMTYPRSISLTTIKKSTLFHMLHIGYSSPSVMALRFHLPLQKN